MEFVRRDELPPRDNTLFIKIHSKKITICRIQWLARSQSSGRYQDHFILSHIHDLPPAAQDLVRRPQHCQDLLPCSLPWDNVRSGLLIQIHARRTGPNVYAAAESNAQKHTPDDINRQSPMIQTRAFRGIDQGMVLPHATPSATWHLTETIKRHALIDVFPGELNLAPLPPARVLGDSRFQMRIETRALCVITCSNARRAGLEMRT